MEEARDHGHTEGERNEAAGLGGAQSLAGNNRVAGAPTLTEGESEMGTVRGSSPISTREDRLREAMRQDVLAESTEDVYSDIPFYGTICHDDEEGGFVERIAGSEPVALSQLLQRRSLKGRFILITHDRHGERIRIPFSVDGRRREEDRKSSLSERHYLQDVAAAKELEAQRIRSEYESRIRGLQEDVDRYRKRAVEAEERLSIMETQQRQSILDLKDTQFQEVQRLTSELSDLKTDKRLLELEIKLGNGDRSVWDRVIDALGEFAPVVLARLGATAPGELPQLSSGHVPPGISGDGMAGAGAELRVNHSELRQNQSEQRVNPHTEEPAKRESHHEVILEAENESMTREEARRQLIEWVKDAVIHQLSQRNGMAGEAARVVMSQIELYRAHGIELGMRDGLYLTERLARYALEQGIGSQQVATVLQPYIASFGLPTSLIDQISGESIRFAFGMAGIDLPAGASDLIMSVIEYLKRASAAPTASAETAAESSIPAGHRDQT